jgi:hypothetical protein
MKVFGVPDADFVDQLILVLKTINTKKFVCSRCGLEMGVGSGLKHGTVNDCLVLLAGRILELARNGELTP